MIKVGIIGVGTVGASVVNILKENADVISARAGVDIVAKSGVVKNLNKILSLKTKKIFLTPGSSSEKVDNKKASVERVENLKEAVEKATHKK